MNGSASGIRHNERPHLEVRQRICISSISRIYFSRYLSSLFLVFFFFFFFNDSATTEIYTLSLHDALPISSVAPRARVSRLFRQIAPLAPFGPPPRPFGLRPEPLRAAGGSQFPRVQGFDIFDSPARRVAAPLARSRAMQPLHPQWPAGAQPGRLGR